MSDLIVPNITCFHTKNTLNLIRVLLKDVLINFSARNFMHAKTSLRASCVHVCHGARNLSSPAHIHF